MSNPPPHLFYKATLPSCNVTGYFFRYFYLPENEETTLRYLEDRQTCICEACQREASNLDAPLSLLSLLYVTWSEVQDLSLEEQNRQIGEILALSFSPTLSIFHAQVTLSDDSIHWAIKFDPIEYVSENEFFGNEVDEERVLLQLHNYRDRDNQTHNQQRPTRPRQSNLNDGHIQ